MESVVKLFSQACVAQSFQVIIRYYISYYSLFIIDSIKTIYFYLWGWQQTKPSTQLSAIPYMLLPEICLVGCSISLKISQNQEFLYEKDRLFTFSIPWKSTYSMSINSCGCHFWSLFAHNYCKGNIVMDIFSTSTFQAVVHVSCWIIWHLYGA